MNIPGEANIKPREIWSARSALRDGAAMLARNGIESSRLEAEVLLAGVLGLRREDLYVHSDAALTSQERSLYEKALGRRAVGEPVAYILGTREFWSLDFFVSPEVLIPRPETELLVELALLYLRRMPAGKGEARGLPLRILDLGTGSGVIAVSLAREREDLLLWATDLSVTAIDTACSNARWHGVAARIHFFQGDLLEPVAERKDFFDAIVSNPPYIRRPEFDFLPPDIAEWEPRIALDGGVDGLDFYRRIIAEAPLYLKPGGLLLVEIGSELAVQVRDLLAASGQYEDCAVHRDYSDKPRVVGARRAPARRG